MISLLSRLENCYGDEACEAMSRFYIDVSILLAVTTFYQVHSFHPCPHTADHSCTLLQVSVPKSPPDTAVWQEDEEDE